MKAKPTKEEYDLPVTTTDMVPSQEIMDASKQGTVLVDLVAKPHVLSVITEALKKEANTISNQMKAISKISNATEYDSARMVLTSSGKISTKVENTRKKVGAPYLASTKLINSTFKDLLTEIEKQSPILDQKIQGWENAEKKRLLLVQKEEEEKQRKALEETNQIAFIKSGFISEIINVSSKGGKEMLECTMTDDLLDKAKEYSSVLKGLKADDPKRDQNDIWMSKEVQEFIITCSTKLKSLYLLKNDHLKALPAVKTGADAKKFEALFQQIAALEEEYYVEAQQQAEQVIGQIEHEQMQAHQNAIGEMAATGAIIDSAIQGSKSAKSYSYAFEVYDINEIPKDWLMLNETAIREWLNEENKKSRMEQNTIVNGVLITVTTKTRKA